MFYWTISPKLIRTLMNLSYTHPSKSCQLHLANVGSIKESVRDIYTLNREPEEIDDEVLLD